MGAPAAGGLLCGTRASLPPPRSFDPLCQNLDLGQPGFTAQQPDLTLPWLTHWLPSHAPPCPAATEQSLLASLWLLESFESVWRSPATVCLNDYLKHLALFSQEVRTLLM